MSKNECRFYPVQCSDETFKKLAPQEGYVYFVTDTKKLYLGKQNEMIPMCSTSGFFYGIKEIEYDNSGILPDPNVIFYLDEIEGEDIPEVDDLILNKDGCFYRVKNVAEDGLETLRLTLQGTGTGGGGGGGGGDSPTGGSFSISVVDGKAKTYASTATEMPVKFKANYNGTDGNYIAQVAFKRKGDENPFYVVDKVYAFNEEQTIDIFAYKSLFNSNKTTVTMYVYDMYGTERSTSITVQIVDLELRKSRDNLIASVSGNTYTYACQLIGATTGVVNKKITYTLYNENNVVVSQQVKELAAADEDEIQYGIQLASLPHGVYTLKVAASADIVGTITTLESNVLTHRFARFTEGSRESLLMVYLPEETEQFTNIPLEYMIVTPDANKSYTVDISINGKSQIKLSAASNNIQSYGLYFEDKGTFALTVTAVELSLTYNTQLTINPYTGNLPVIDSTRDDLMLYLNPKNKSNDALDRDVWSDYNGNYSGTLTGLHYGTSNGWLLDEHGVSHLSLTSGAKFEMPDFRPFEKDPTKNDATDSRMGSGMTIELDFEINGVLDYDSELIKCISRNKDGDVRVGFSITGDSAQFYSNRGKLLAMNLVEGKRTRVGFTIEPNTGTISFPMICGYLNGKISGAVIYDGTSDVFKDAIDGPAYITIDASSAQIKVYGIRVYSTALSDRILLNNYTASLATLDERQAAYDSNNVFNANGKVDFMKVCSEDYNLQIPYMVLTGGYANEKDDKWKRKNSNDTSARLPTGKKDYRSVDVKIVYPKNSSAFKDYKDYEFKNEYSGKTMAEAYGEKPSNGGMIMYAQGTSSMEYPVKNLRLRAKKDKNFFTVDPKIAPVEIICMKADYMESSGSHNTGTANLVDDIYSEVKITTPGQREFKDNGKIVTCIKGHPCLIFYSPTGAEGTYEYVGKYNLNLDKATPEPFGFINDKNIDFGWLKENDEYYEILYGDKGENYKDPFIGQLEPTEGADYVPGQDEENAKAIVGVGEKVNAIHCFEFLDNAVEVCNFKNKNKSMIEDLEHPGEMIPDPSGGTYTYHETWYNTFKNKDGDDVPGWTLGFESRYPEDRIGYHDADALYPLASWINELYSIRTGINGYEKDEELALLRFKEEYRCYLNREFVLAYYLITESLLMVDSRVKNMMIATWGKENYEGKNSYQMKYNYIKDDDGHWVKDEASGQTTNNYIFYPIFYDMDTMLGLDNSGSYRFKYYDEDTDPSIYNGDEILWNLVRDALGDEIRPYFSSLEGALLNTNSVLPYYNLNQANMANEAFYNGDAKYKYIDPARYGYHDDLYDKDIAAGAGPYLSAAQGDRSLMREYFITNRFKFIRGKYKSGHFQQNDRIEFRLYYPKTADTGFTNGVDGKDHSATITAVSPTKDFTFTSLRTGYSGVQVGANASDIHTSRFNGEETKVITVPEVDSANGTEAYLLGLSNLSDLGDLSTKYMQRFIINSTDVRLKTLTLGNPHKDYYNPYWNNSANGLPSKIDVSKAIYLENFNLQNCLAYRNSIDFSTCPVIQKILLTGSGVNAITLPSGGMIKELRLPSSITRFTIENHTGLTANNFSMGTYEYDTTLPYEQQKIGAGNGKYINDYSKIASLKVINTPIDTYEMVINAGNLEEYCLRNINWTITADNAQYCMRKNSSDLTPEQIRSYYIYNSTSKEYELWDKDTYPTGGVFLYEKVQMLNANKKVVSIPALDYLMTKNILDGTSHAEALTGTITIDIEGASAVELEIYQKYVDTYPDVKIKYGPKMSVEGANRVNFYYTEYTEGVDPEKLTPYFSVLTAKQESTLAQLVNTELFTPPSKTPTNYIEYNFTGRWIDATTNKVYFQDNGNYNPPENVVYELFSITRPNANMNLFPVFEAYTRQYEVIFYDDKGNQITGIWYEYDATLRDGFSTEGYGVPLAQAEYHYKPDDGTLQEHERFALEGWISEQDYINNVENPTLIDLNTTHVTASMKVYAKYKIEDAQKVASPNSLFTFTDCNYTTENKSKVVGRMAQLNPHCLGFVRGKITIPSTDPNGNKIVAIGPMHVTFTNEDANGVVSYQSAEYINEIYFLEDSECVLIGANACKGMEELHTIHFPPSIQYFGASAFSETRILAMSNLPSGLKEIEQSAFYRGRTESGGDMTKITISELPNSLEYLGSQVFMYCPNVAISIFGGPESALKHIGYMAFGYAGSSTVTSITINANAMLNALSESYGYRTFYDGYAGVTDLYLRNGQTLNVDNIASNLFGRDSNITVHQEF